MPRPRRTLTEEEAQTAADLLEEALFLRANGERPPGSPDATWRAWDHKAEPFLRGLLPPEREDGNGAGHP